jgi:hypothetical protein
LDEEYKETVSMNRRLWDGGDSFILGIMKDHSWRRMQTYFEHSHSEPYDLSYRIESVNQKRKYRLLECRSLTPTYGVTVFSMTIRTTKT